jgi:hypothetical protein
MEERERRERGERKEGEGGRDNINKNRLNSRKKTENK